MITPREEEPWIKVPMVDPSACPVPRSGRETRLIGGRAAVYEIEGVEYLYSISQPSGGIIIARFGLARTGRRHPQQTGRKRRPGPAGAMPLLVKLRTIDDVPALAYTLGAGVKPLELRAAAEELRAEISATRARPRLEFISQPRTVTVAFDATRLAAYNSSLLQAGRSRPTGACRGQCGRAEHGWS